MDMKDYERIAVLKAIEQAKENKEPAKWTGPTMHYTELTEDKSGKPGSGDWNCYVREVGRLLAEGNEGRWVLIHGEQIVGIYDTQTEVSQVGCSGFSGKGA